MKSCKFRSLALLAMSKTPWEITHVSWGQGHSLEQGRGPKIEVATGDFRRERGKIFRKVKHNASLDSNSFIQTL